MPDASFNGMLSFAVYLILINPGSTQNMMTLSAKADRGRREIKMPYQDGVYGCPAEAALHMISGKWKPRIIHELFQGTKRFGELQRLLPGISRHVLTTQLRELEADNLVERTVYPTVPPKVEYSLTDFGRSLEPVLEQLVGVGERYILMQRNR
jgi:DNA-binding HxlR family transcriptional regulator